MAEESGDGRTFRNDAFISYSTEDSKFAAKLERALEGYRPVTELDPERRRPRVFRYEGDWDGTDYDEAIARHLKDSRRLILLCSPDARKSEFVSGEVDLFVGFRGAESIIPILLRGAPNNEATEEEEKAFPEALCRHVRMPLAVDYRGFDPDKGKVTGGDYAPRWYSLIANLYQASRDLVEQRESARRLRALGIWLGVAGAVAVVMFSLAVAFFLQRNESRRSQAELLVNQASVVAGEGDSSRAIAMLSASARLDPDYEAARAMLLGMIDREPWQVPVRQLEQPGEVRLIAFSPSGDAVIAGMENGKVAVWNPLTGDKHGEDLEHPGQVNALAFTEDGKTLVVAAGDGLARVWDLEARSSTDLRHEPGAEIMALALSADASWVATGTRDGSAWIWSLSSRDPEPTPLPHAFASNPRAVGQLEVSDDEKRLLSRSQHGVRVWDSPSGRLVAILTKRMTQESRCRPYECVYSANFVPGTHRILLGYEFGGSELFDPSDGSRFPLKPMGRVFDVFSDASDATRIFARGVVQPAHLYDFEHNTREVRPLTEATFPEGGLIRNGVFGPSGDRLATHNASGMVKLWGADGRPLSMPAVSGSRPAFHPDGSLLASASGSTMVLWTTGRAPGAQKQVIDQDLVIRRTEHEPAFSPDGRWVGSVANGGLRIYRAQDGTPMRRLGLAESSTGHLTPDDRQLVSLTFSIDGEWAIASLFRRDVVVAQVSSEEIQLLRHPATVRAARLSPDGRFVMTACDDGSAYRWNFAPGAGKVLSVENALAFPVSEKPVTDVQISPSSQEVVTGAEDGSVAMWDSEGALRWKYKDPESDSPIDRIRVSSEHVLSAARDGTARILRASDGRPIHSLEHPRAVYSVDLAPNGAKALTAAALAAQLWDIENGEAFGEPLAHEAELAIRGGWRNRVMVSRFSPGGGRVATGGRDGQVRIWDVRTRVPLSPPLKHQHEVLGLSFDATGDRLAVATRDRKLTVWTVFAASPANADAIAELGEAVAGLSLGANQTTVPIEDRAARFHAAAERARSDDTDGLGNFVRRTMGDFHRDAPEDDTP